VCFFVFSSRRRHTRCGRDWSSDVCSSDLLGSGAWAGRYSFASRFADGQGTNPEELIGAAHAGCFAMALSAALERSGHAPRRVAATAAVHLDPGAEGGPKINLIELRAEGAVPGI